MPIGDKLEALIEERGTNPNKLSAQTGVNVNTIYSMIRRNNLKADLAVLKSLAAALGVTLDYFLDSDRLPEIEKSPTPEGAGEDIVGLAARIERLPEAERKVVTDLVAVLSSQQDE